MSKRIIVLLKPFCKEQSIYVYEDGNAIDAKEIEMKELNNQLEIFIKEYDISQVDLVGPSQYAKGISKKFKKEKLTTYTENKVTISII